MATGPLAPVVRYLRQVTSSSASGELPDGELLCRFTRHRDEAAFTILVRRHGPMVLAVCRRVVRDGHAAEDAFQATFLVLARKAASLAHPELLGNWLHGVAYRTALKARRVAAKRHAHETQVVRVQEVDPSAEIDRHDLRAVVDEEINRLPERYRVPVVLCYLQGQTNAETARRLGCSRGTVATLLARARDRLRRRLTQRGIGLSVGVALGAFLPVARGGTVSLALENVTVKAAALLSAGHTQAVRAVATQAVVLAKGVSKGMLLEKLKIPVAILIVTALVGMGAGVGVYRASAPGTEVAESPVEVKPRLPSKAQEPRKHVAAPAELPKDQKAAFRTVNFVVTAPTMEIARQVGEAAEHNRKELARLWLNKELPAWAKACPVRVTVTGKTSGGASEFAFEDGTVSWGGMFLEGPLDRIFADLLPHEMTHTILAEWRGRPLPRWADEGAAMLSESAVCREKHEQAMERLLRTGHPLPLTELLPRLDYPKDVTAFYAQSFSLTDFLVTAGGQKKFLKFVAKGTDNNWNEAAQFVYGYKSLQALEQAWFDHARNRLTDKRSDESLRKPPAAPLARHSFRGELPTKMVPFAQILVLLGEDGRLTVCQKDVSYRPVTEAVTLKSGRKHAITTYEEEYHSEVAVLPLDKVRVYDTKGRKIDAKELRKHLKGETLALRFFDDGPIDPLQLRLYKEDTLIVVIDPQQPAAAVAPRAVGVSPTLAEEAIYTPGVPPPLQGVPLLPPTVPASPPLVPPAAP